MTFSLLRLQRHRSRIRYAITSKTAQRISFIPSVSMSNLYSCKRCWIRDKCEEAAVRPSSSLMSEGCFRSLVAHPQQPSWRSQSRDLKITVISMAELFQQAATGRLRCHPSLCWKRQWWSGKMVRVEAASSFPNTPNYSRLPMTSGKESMRHGPMLSFLPEFLRINISGLQTLSSKLSIAFLRHRSQVVC